MLLQGEAEVVVQGEACAPVRGGILRVVIIHPELKQPEGGEQQPVFLSFQVGFTEALVPAVVAGFGGQPSEPGETALQLQVPAVQAVGDGFPVLREVLAAQGIIEVGTDVQQEGPGFKAHRGALQVRLLQPVVEEVGADLETFHQVKAIAQSEVGTQAALLGQGVRLQV